MDGWMGVGGCCFMSKHLNFSSSSPSFAHLSFSNLSFFILFYFLPLRKSNVLVGFFWGGDSVFVRTLLSAV